MREPERKCGVCRALIDEEDLFCANCGAEAPHDPDRENKTESRISTHNFTCAGCGASMSYDASAQTLRCPFCGSERLEQQQDKRTISPRRVVPFRVEKQQAQAGLRQWLGQGWLRPSDLTEAAVVTKMTGVYVPYWVFEASTHTYWTADTSQTPFGARGDWFPMAGEHHGHYRGLLVGASGALTAWETEMLCPFELSAAVPVDQVDLENVTVEQFSVPRKYARPLAQRGLENLERQACDNHYVPGRSRNVHVDVLLEGLSSEPILLPVWIMAYRYKEKTYRFLINGQTGEPHGQKPTSYKKILMIVGVVLAVIVCVMLLLGMCGGAAALFNAGAGDRFERTAESVSQSQLDNSILDNDSICCEIDHNPPPSRPLAVAGGAKPSAWDRMDLI